MYDLEIYIFVADKYIITDTGNYRIDNKNAPLSGVIVYKIDKCLSESCNISIVSGLDSFLFISSHVNQ
jgi:hypothetical protein